MNNESMTDQVIKNSFWNFIMTLCARIGSLIFTILIARFLLPEKFGIYNLAMSIFLTILVIVDTGINQALVKFVSESLDKDKKRAASLLRYIRNLKILATIIFSGILILFAYPLSYFIFKKPDLFFPLIFSGLYLIISSITSFYTSLFYVIKKTKFLTIKQLIFEFARIAGILLVFLLTEKQLINWIIIVLIISTFFILVYTKNKLKKLAPYLFKKYDEKIDEKIIKNFVYSLGIIGAFSVIFGYMDVIMLGIFLEASFIGFYAAAIAIVANLSTLLNLSYVLLPIFTRIQKQKIENIFNKITRYLSILTIPCIFGLIILSDFFIKLIYGIKYAPAVLPLYFLSILIFELPIINILIYLFYAKDNPKYILKITILITILNIILNYTFIKVFLRISSNWAMGGVAIATVISQSIYLLMLIIYAKKRLSIKLDFSFVIKPLIASIIMALMIILINYFISPLNLIIAISEIILGILVYFLIMFLIKGINKEDLLLIKKLNPKLILS